MPIFLISFLIFLGVYTWKLKQVKSNYKDYVEEFMEAEQKASWIRKKPIEDLPLIEIDLSHLPIWEKEPAYESEKNIWLQQKKVLETATLPMVNLTTQNNLDLKLQYGPANLEALTDYESNFIRFLQYIIMWGKALQEANYTKEAIQVLEYGVHIGSDLSQNYILLADLYQTNHDTQKLAHLLEQASSHSSLNMKKANEYIYDLLHESNTESL